MEENIYLCGLIIFIGFILYKLYKISKERDEAINELRILKAKCEKLERLKDQRATYLNQFLCSDNLTGFPYIASLIADYKLVDLDYAIISLNWGQNVKRQQKVCSLIEIRKELKAVISQYKEIQYQLDYLKTLYPAIDDILSTTYSDLDVKDITNTSNVDSVKKYLSKEEYNALSQTEANQLALDRYIESHKKNKWQVGRDYELYVGYKYSILGYEIDYFGSYNGVADLGRDLIAKKEDTTLIIQCKYWGKDKEIHENHIAQLYGTYICYCLENNVSTQNVHAVLITSTKLSKTAKQFAEFLGVSTKENYQIGEYPRIKCNVNYDEFGKKSYIYHLPMDQQYDAVKINKPEECFAFTVKEAEEKGFRRAYKWHGFTLD